MPFRSRKLEGNTTIDCRESIDAAIRYLQIDPPTMRIVYRIVQTSINRIAELYAFEEDLNLTVDIVSRASTISRVQ